MAGERSYLSVPPDSTGKKVHLNHTAQLFYTGATPGYVWNTGVEYTLQQGWKIHVHDVYKTSTTDGILFVSFPTDQIYGNVNPTPGENILDSDSVVQAQVVSHTDVYHNTTNIMGYDNPKYGVNVDANGSMNVRFSEGVPQLDAFGKLRSSGATILGDYIFKNDILPTLFSARLVGAGHVAHDDDKHCAHLMTTNANNDLVAFTSNTYHHYFPGSGQLIMMTVACGQTTTDITRQWGYFDATNGYFFRQVNGVLQLVIRSDATGSVVDNVITVDDWNRDPVDGTGISGMVLNHTDDNIYWIDLQWLGAGRVRFGTYYNGERVTMHEYYHHGNGGFPHAATGALPICYTQKTTGTGAASLNEMHAWCAGVWSEADIQLSDYGRNALATFSATIDLPTFVSSGAEYHYIGTLTPAKVINGSNHRNSSIYFPTYLEGMAWDENGNDARVEIEVYADPVLSGNTTSFENGLVEVEPINPNNSVVKDDPSVTGSLYHGGGSHVIATYFKGSQVRDLTQAYRSFTSGSFKNYAENGGTKKAPIANITQASPAVLTVSTPQLPIREGEPYVITGVSGMTEINNQTVYIRTTGITTCELYQDAAFTTPVNSSAYTAYTSGGIATGDYGAWQYFTVVVKPITPSTSGTLNVRFNLGWKEISQ